jgi:hypothetical protein
MQKICKSVGSVDATAWRLGTDNQTRKPGIGRDLPGLFAGRRLGRPYRASLAGGGDHPGRCPGLVYFAPLGLGIVRRPSQGVWGDRIDRRPLHPEIGDRQTDSSGAPNANGFTRP